MLGKDCHYPAVCHPSSWALPDHAFQFASQRPQCGYVPLDLLETTACKRGCLSARPLRMFRESQQVAETVTYQVESVPPQRLVRWVADDGEEAVLLGSTREAYWKLNGPGGESHLKALGLPVPAPTKRPPAR